jgi:hypothetical protein
MPIARMRILRNGVTGDGLEAASRTTSRYKQGVHSSPSRALGQGLQLFHRPVRLVVNCRQVSEAFWHESELDFCK